MYVSVVFDPSVPVLWLFHAPEQTTAIVVLPCMDLVCGTVFLMNWDHLIWLWLRSETNWRRYYLTRNCSFLRICGILRKCVTDVLSNNNNNNNNNNKFRHPFLPPPPRHLFTRKHVVLAIKRESRSSGSTWAQDQENVRTGQSKKFTRW